MTRVMKARKSSRVACGCYVLRGQKIHSQDGTTWICEPCQLAANKTSAGSPPAAVPTERTAP